MILKTIIIDDDIACIQRLHDDLSAFPDIIVTNSSSSASSEKEMIIKEKPDLLFLDIEMPDMNGFSLLHEIQPFINPNLCVVFYTAFSQYMLEAIRASAFDYLLKPYTKEELSCIIHRVKEKQINGQNLFQHLLQHLSAYDSGFTVQTATGILRLRGSEVLYLSYIKETRCWKLVLANGSKTEHKLRSTTKSKDILNLYPAFFQINQDTILNLDYVVSLEKNRYCILQPPFHNLKFEVSSLVYSKLKEKFIII